MNLSFGTNMLPRMKVRRQKFGLGTLITMLILGAGFIAIGVLTIKSSKIDPSWTKISGTIVGSSTSTSDGSTTYAAVVQYKVEGQAYKVASSTSSSSYPHIGASKQVAYDPAHPDHAKVVDNFVWFLYIFPVVGLFMLIGAPLGYIKSLRRGSDINHLVHDGQKIEGVIVELKGGVDSGTTNSGGYKIVVEATDPSGQVQSYVSDSLSGLGGLALIDFQKQPVPIDVYVNRADPKDYYVDISDIPGLTPERITELIQSAKDRLNKQ
ncbi:MAG TPA: DUF3592 domain-containing protein [Candidatus Saccharimonadales bacterium]|nr:DUF3592 domain-containing protein [Candidatus Saccharimonadales bacterium]